MAETPEIGSTVQFYYKGGPKGEEPQDMRLEGEPFRAMIGQVSIPRGLELALKEMTRGEERTIEIPPELGFGEHQEKHTTWYSRYMMNGIGENLHVGDRIYWTNPDTGQRMPAYVTDETDALVFLDFNHPWAGKTLEYWVKVIDFD